MPVSHRCQHRRRRHARSTPLLRCSVKKTMMTMMQEIMRKLQQRMLELDDHLRHHQRQVYCYQYIVCSVIDNCRAATNSRCGCLYTLKILKSLMEFDSDQNKLGEGGRSQGKVCFACGVLSQLQWSQNKYSLTTWVLLSVFARIMISLDIESTKCLQVFSCSLTSTPRPICILWPVCQTSGRVTEIDVVQFCCQ